VNPRPVWVGLYDPGYVDAEVIAVSTDRAMLEVAIDHWRDVNWELAGARPAKDDDPDYVDIIELTLLEKEATP
jgi:hypothetical protein